MNKKLQNKKVAEINPQSNDVASAAELEKFKIAENLHYTQLRDLSNYNDERVSKLYGELYKVKKELYNVELILAGVAVMSAIMFAFLLSTLV